jgi:hypothetical protein
MSVALRFVSVALQRARETFVNSKNKISNEDEVRNEYLSQVLLHGIGVFSDGSKLCDKLPANTGTHPPCLCVKSCVERSLSEN